MYIRKKYYFLIVIVIIVSLLTIYFLQNTNIDTPIEPTLKNTVITSIKNTKYFAVLTFDNGKEYKISSLKQNSDLYDYIGKPIDISFRISSNTPYYEIEKITLK